MTHEIETIKVHAHFASALVNDDTSGLSDDETREYYVLCDYIDYMAKSYEDCAGYHLGDVGDEYFGSPTKIPSYPSVDMSTYNLRGNVVDIDIVIMINPELGAVNWL